MHSQTILLVVGAASLLCEAVLAKNPFPSPQPAQVARGKIFRDSKAFDTAAGQPPLAISFDDMACGIDLNSQTICGVTFHAIHAPLEIVRADETFTTRDYKNVSDPEQHKLISTTGPQLLSPGGTMLVPGPDPAIEDDDIIMTFDPPVAAFGFDHISQYADGMSYTSITVFDTEGDVMYTGTVDIGPAPQDWDIMISGRRLEQIPPPQVSTADFWGFVSPSANIREIRIDEHDDNDVCPDSNIGIDSLRFAPAGCGAVGDISDDGRVNAVDVHALLDQWGPYEIINGNMIQWRSADLNCNGRVDGLDLMMMLEHAG